MFDFQKFEVYKKAKTFHKECKDLILKSKFDKYVIDQLGRASFSVPLNIAEGSGKFSKADRKNYFTTARASGFECVAVMDFLTGEGEMNTEKYTGFYQRYEELSKILFRMIQNLEGKKKDSPAI